MGVLSERTDLKSVTKLSANRPGMKCALRIQRQVVRVQRLKPVNHSKLQGFAGCLMLCVWRNRARSATPVAGGILPTGFRFSDSGDDSRPFVLKPYASSSLLIL